MVFVLRSGVQCSVVSGCVVVLLFCCCVMCCVARWLCCFVMVFVCVACIAFCFESQITGSLVFRFSNWESRVNLVVHTVRFLMLHVCAQTHEEISCARSPHLSFMAASVRTLLFQTAHQQQKGRLKRSRAVENISGDVQ